MTRGEIIEICLLRINGGTLNSEASVHREDIRAYLPSAVNYALTASYNIGIRAEGIRDISGLFWGSFYDLAITRTEPRKPRITLPKGTIALPRNQGIRRIVDDCDQVYTPLQDGDLHSIEYMQNVLSGSNFFRLFPTYIELYTLNPLVTKINELNMITRTEDLLDTDILPIPAGMEDTVIDLCYDKFSPQRRNPADKLNNTVDLNAQP